MINSFFFQVNQVITNAERLTAIVLLLYFQKFLYLLHKLVFSVCTVCALFIGLHMLSFSLDTLPLETS